LIEAAEIIIVTSERIQRILLATGFLLAAILLIRFTVDFFHEMPLLLAIPFAILAAASLLLVAMNLLASANRATATSFSAEDDRRATAAKRFLLASIPLGFLASTLDCSGLAPQGCSPFCTWVKLLGIPLLALVCAAYFFKPINGLLTLISALSFVGLVPHCVCYNVGNGWWIERLGASPMCYVWGFVVTLIAASAIRSGARVWLSLLVNSAIIGGALAFFISHHYFHFPW
jgi:hypothetical protein